MAMDVGLSFAPGAQPGTAKRRNPVQEAVQILSLRLPKVFGAAAPAPAPLLTGQGGMGQPAARGNVMAQTLAQLAGLPPGMASPPQMAPTLSAGTDTTRGWLQQERGLNVPNSGTSRESSSPDIPILSGTPRVDFRSDTGEGPAAPAAPLPAPWSDPSQALPEQPIGPSLPPMDDFTGRGYRDRYPGVVQDAPQAQGGPSAMDLEELLKNMGWGQGGGW